MSLGMTQTHRGGRIFVAVALAATVLGLTTTARSAAPYVQMTVRPDLVEDPNDAKKAADAKKAKRELELAMTEILRGAVPLDDKGKKVIDDYYRRFYFAVLTHEADLPNWVDRREKFLKMLTQSNIPAASP